MYRQSSIVFLLLTESKTFSYLMQILLDTHTVVRWNQYSGVQYSDRYCIWYQICSLISRRLPVLHIYTDLPINIEDLEEQIQQKFGTDVTNLAIFYDVRYHRAFTQSKNIFEKLSPNLNIFVCEPCTEARQSVQCGRICPEKIDSTWVTLYIGQNENYSLLLGLTFPEVLGHFVFDPQSESPKIEQSSVNVKKALMKRYYLIERARDAARIGIIVGTLGVTRYRNVIDYVKDVVKKSGKKSYTFLVGKPNVPKLANFSEVHYLKRKYFPIWFQYLFFLSVCTVGIQLQNIWSRL